MWNYLRKQGIFARSAALLIFEIAIFAGITPFLWMYGPARSIVAAGAAAGVCTGGALLAIWIDHFFSDQKFALSTLLIGMSINMGIPLALALAVQFQDGPMRQAGFIYYLLFFYLLTLSARTILSLHLPRQAAQNNHSSQEVAS
jgi:hypothetical protein